MANSTKMIIINSTRTNYNRLRFSSIDRSNDMEENRSRLGKKLIRLPIRVLVPGYVEF